MRNTLSPVAGSQPIVIRFLASFFSYIFHPVFIATYVMGFLLFVYPDAYSRFDEKTKVLRFITVFFSTAFLPIFCVFLLWSLKLFTQSMELKTSKERIIPYLLVMIFYFWMWHVFNNLSDSPVVTKFFLGSFLGVCGAWFSNI